MCDECEKVLALSVHSCELFTMRNRQISIKVAGEKWKVIFKKPTEEDYIGVEDDDIGLCVAEENKIYVDPDPDTVVSTFLHEVLHAVFPQLSEDAVIDGENAILDAFERFPRDIVQTGVNEA